MGTSSSEEEKVKNEAKTDKVTTTLTIFDESESTATEESDESTTSEEDEKDEAQTQTSTLTETVEEDGTIGINIADMDNPWEVNNQTKSISRAKTSTYKVDDSRHNKSVITISVLFCAFCALFLGS